MTASRGYDDTPVLPHIEYRVHDPDRPRPPAVDPGTESLPRGPPSDATVLIDPDAPGLDAWEGADGGPAPWDVSSDAVTVVPESGDIRTRDPIGDCQLHVEWRAPNAAAAEDGQDSGNSGVFLADRYEVQVLNTHDNPTYADGYAGAVYGQHPPRVNPCRPPGEWQSYDLVWHAPRFDGDEDGTAADAAVAEPATLTLFHNGVLVQDHVELLGATTHRDTPAYEPHPPAAPLRLQDHGDRVAFRNVWYRPLDD